MDVYHVGTIFPKRYLFLKKVEPDGFQWFLEGGDMTPFGGKSPAEAIQAAYNEWKDDYFRLLNCGFRYSLPERDEVGCKAFFWEMAKSYSTHNGRYFDDELGHHCYVDFASEEALSLWRKLR